MNCPRCNTPFVADSRFCGICGYSVSASQENANSSPAWSGNDDATQMASSWPGAPTVRQMSPSAQPGTFQPQQGGSWPQQGAQAGYQSQPGAWQQQPQAGWQPPMQSQPGAWQQQQEAQTVYPQGMMPGTLNSSGVTFAPARKRKSGGRVLRRMLVSLVLLLAIVAGAWFLGVRPYVHNMVQTQLNQALDGAESQILLFQDALPSGSQSVTVDENTINNYLSLHDTNQIQNLHATITPQSFNLDFSTYGYQCTISAVPIARNGLLQVTNVQVQGVLGLVMSNDELTTDLNNNFKSFGQQMHRSIGQVTLKEHEMDIIIN